MKCSVYILLLQNGQYYIGSANDVDARFKQHLHGTTKSLVYRKPIQILFRQEFETLSQARIVENKLKRYKKRSIIEKIIHDQIIKHTGL